MRSSTSGKIDIYAKKKKTEYVYKILEEEKGASNTNFSHTSVWVNISFLSSSAQKTICFLLFCKYVSGNITFLFVCWSHI